MATCGSIQHIFEKTMPENQNLLESLTSSWSQNVKSVEQTEKSSFSELFDSSQMSTIENQNKNKNPSKDISFTFPLGTNHSNCNKNDNGFSSMKSGSLQFCTEGLGFESFDDVEDVQGEVINEKWKIKEEKVVSTSVKHFASEISSGEFRRSRVSKGAFPPPISFIGKSGKPGVSFKSYRQDGRFVLKEVRIPTQEFLQASREDGRLKLKIIQPNDDILEEEDEDDEEHVDVEDYSEKDEEENDVSNVRDRDEA